MYPNQNPQQHYNQAGYGIFMQSLLWLSNLLAIVITFFAAPEVYNRTINFVFAFTAKHYTAGFEDIVSMIWWVIVAAFIFCVVRMSISTLFVVGGLSLAAKLL
jgi:hypothetical protein